MRSNSDVQTIKFLPPPARHLSLTKSSRKEEEMFNLVDFDQPSRTLVLSNSARISIIALHLASSRGKAEGFNIVNQPLESEEPIEIEHTTSPEKTFPSPNSAYFDYMIEYPINQLIGSFVIVPEKYRFNGFSLYCTQSKAVQQYHLVKDLLLPNNIEACPIFETTSRGISSTEQENKQTQAVSEDNEVIKEDGEKSTTKENFGEQDLVKETVIVKTCNTNTSNSETTIVAKESEETEAIQKRTQLESMLESASDNANVLEEADAKGLEQHKTTGIRLSGPIVNGTIAKLKEKKKMASASVAQGEIVVSDSEKGSRRKESRRAADREKENTDGTPETSGKFVGKKAMAEGVSARKLGGSEKKTQQEAMNNNRITGGKNFPTAKQQPNSSGYDPLLTHDGSQTGLSRSMPTPEMSNNQNFTKELKKIEDSITNKIGKMFTKEMEKQYQRLEDERIAHQAAETSRQETILKYVSQTLSNNTEKLLDTTIRNEIQTAVVPTLNKMVSNAVDKQINRGMVEAINKSIPVAIEKAVAENVQRVLSKSSVIDSIAKGVSKSMRPIIEEIFRENFSNMLIPSYQNATTVMFEQIHRAFEAGVQQIAQKTAQSSNVTPGVDSNAIARLQASIDQLNHSMQQLQQVQQLQASMQANLMSHLSGQHAEQQTGRTSNDLQNQLTRSLTGELKRILIPQGQEPAPALSHESYNYASSVRPPQQQQQQHQHHLQQRQQIFSPMEPPNLVELKASIDRYLEMREYEEAFLKALASNDLSIILRLCSKVSPKVVFFPSRPLLSQPVILSLVHQLTLELNKYPDLKFAWVEEALIHLNPKDVAIREHCQRILQIAKTRLVDRYTQIASEDTQNPNLKTITVLIHVLNSLMT